MNQAQETIVLRPTNKQVLLSKVMGLFGFLAGWNLAYVILGDWNAWHFLVGLIAVVIDLPIVYFISRKSLSDRATLTLSAAGITGPDRTISLFQGKEFIAYDKIKRITDARWPSWLVPRKITSIAGTRVYILSVFSNKDYRRILELIAARRPSSAEALIR